MKRILELIVSTSILCDDLHYSSNGANFYSLHLLADRIKDPLSKFMDELREAYYLGELFTVPPKTDEIYSEAIKISSGIRTANPSGDVNTSNLLSVKDALNRLIHMISEVKRSSSMLSGTESILDSITAHSQTMFGLVERITTTVKA